LSWIQAYDPARQRFLSTLVAALPIVVLLLGLGRFEWRAYVAALVSVLVALGHRSGVDALDFPERHRDAVGVAAGQGVASTEGHLRCRSILAGRSLRP
jgi:hypothetical protein